MKKYKFGVLGAGNMGTAIAEGAVRAGRFAPEQVLMFNRSEEKRAAHAAKGYAVTGDYTEVSTACNSEIVLLAVKPQNFDEILPDPGEVCQVEKPLVVSDRGGRDLRQAGGRARRGHARLIRVMPNTPLMLRRGGGAAGEERGRNRQSSCAERAAPCSTPWARPSAFDAGEACSTRSFLMQARRPALYLRLRGRDACSSAVAARRATEDGRAPDAHLPDHDRLRQKCCCGGTGRPPS